MKVSGNTILITGGSSGIGLAMAELLAETGNKIIVCGRDKKKLQMCQNEINSITVYPCDISKKNNCKSLFTRVTSDFPDVTILINNAGIQKEIDFKAGASELLTVESELDTNLWGSIYLSALFVPYFLNQKKECAIVNVTSGLAFIPLQGVPIYCATKAALHSFSMSLRYQLANTNIKVFEIIPPIVQTDLHRGEVARRQAKRGISPKRVAKETLRALKKDHFEKTIGQAKDLQIASRIAPRFFGRLLNKMISN